MTAASPAQSLDISMRPAWQAELARAFKTPLELAEYLGLDPELVAQHQAARELFPMLVPRPFADLMKPGDINDPLLRQVLPQQAEFEAATGFITDPLAEHDAVIPGLLHKYPSRVLVLFRGGCAVNCRYCFRRHFPYADNTLGKSQRQQVLAYVQAHPELNEVILSGGDPLMANDSAIIAFAQALANIPHVKRLRIHSRLPIVIPQRLVTQLANDLIATGLQIILVLHANHAQEISPALVDGLSTWRQAGVTLLNQSVLLKGVNDHAETLAVLSERLFAAQVLPYYLHVLDRVAGASHFLVEDAEALQLMQQLRTQLPGFLVPKLVREEAGELSKTPLV